jgi:hypothetical protein
MELIATLEVKSMHGITQQEDDLCVGNENHDSWQTTSVEMLSSAM